MFVAEPIRALPRSRAVPGNTFAANQARVRDVSVVTGS